MSPTNSLRKSIICKFSIFFFFWKIQYLSLISYKFKSFSHNLPVIRSKDCTEIDWNTNGRQMLQIFKDQPVQPNIFQEFEYMDYREDWLISQRQMAKMMKQNYPNMGGAGYYGGYGYMPPQMNYMYQGYGGIPGVGYNRDYYENIKENQSFQNGDKKEKKTHNIVKYEVKNEEPQEEQKI